MSNNDNGLCPRMPDERNEPFSCDICMDKVHGDMYEFDGIQVCKKCYYQHNKWEDDSIQFPRLIAEIIANVNIDDLAFQDLQDSMDLSRAEVNSLFDRAIASWEKAKEGLTT